MDTNTEIAPARAALVVQRHLLPDAVAALETLGSLLPQLLRYPPEKEFAILVIVPGRERRITYASASELHGSICEAVEYASDERLPAPAAWVRFVADDIDRGVIEPALLAVHEAQGHA